MKPRVSPRRGLSGQRVWLCFTVEDMGFWSVVRKGYGYTIPEAYAEWEQS